MLGSLRSMGRSESSRNALKIILICVLKMNGDLTGLERHEDE